MKQHIANASWSGLAATLRAGYGLLNVLLIIHLLGPDNYGKVATLLSLFGLYCSLISSIFTVLVVKLMATSDEFEKEQLFASGLLCVLTSVSVLVILASFFGILATGLFSTIILLPAPQTAQIIVVMSLFASVQILGAYQLALIESVGRLDVGMKSQLIGPCIVLIILLVETYFDIRLSSYYYVIILCIGGSIDFICAWIARRQVLSIKRENLCFVTAWQFLCKLIKYGSILQATSLMNMFLEPLNKTLLNIFLGGSGVTIYDLNMKIIWGIQSIFSSAMRVFLHIASKDFGQFENSYVHFIRLLSAPALLLHVLACLFLSIISQFWLFLDTYEVILFFGIATLSNLGMIAVMPLYNGFIGRENMIFIFKIQARLALINVLASFCFIPIAGVFGAAVGLLLATIYNAQAIIKKSKALTGCDQLTNSLINNLSPNFRWALALFGLAIFSGIYTELMWPFCPIIAFFVFVILTLEPIFPIVLTSILSLVGKR